MAMKVVDDQGVRMDFAVIPKMRVIRWQVAVVVLDDLRVICGPKDHRADEPEGSESTHEYECDVQPKTCTETSCERIGDQPAGMA